MLTRTVATKATNISLAEAKRVRFLPPCACEFPLGFTDAPSPHVPTCESKQGAIQLADDGRAETPSKIDEMGDLIVDLKSVSCCRCRDLQSCDKAIDVQNLIGLNFDGLVFHENAKSQESEDREWSTENVRYDLMHFTHDSSYGTEVEVAVDIADSKVVEAEDGMIFF